MSRFNCLSISNELIISYNRILLTMHTYSNTLIDNNNIGIKDNCINSYLVIIMLWNLWRIILLLLWYYPSIFNGYVAYKIKICLA